MKIERVTCIECNGSGIGFYQHDDNGELIYSYPCDRCNGCGYLEVEYADENKTE